MVLAAIEFEAGRLVTAAAAVCLNRTVLTGRSAPDACRSPGVPRFAHTPVVADATARAETLNVTSKDLAGSGRQTQRYCPCSSESNTRVLDCLVTQAVHVDALDSIAVKSTQTSGRICRSSTEVAVTGFRLGRHSCPRFARFDVAGQRSAGRRRGIPKKIPQRT